jgi:hypothetical protein
MIQKEDYKHTMMFIILRVGLTLQITHGFGDSKEEPLLEVLPLVYRQFLISMLMDFKQFIQNILTQKISNKLKYT